MGRTDARRYITVILLYCTYSRPILRVAVPIANWGQRHYPGVVAAKDSGDAKYHRDGDAR